MQRIPIRPLSKFLVRNNSRLATPAFFQSSLYSTMRAARYYGKEDVRIEQIDEPVVKAGQVKIAPSFVGICGTDLHEYLGGPNFCPTTPHGITGETLPVGLGHEFSGIVKELGAGVSRFKVGDKVVIQPTLACGHCAACTSGAENVCNDGGFVGLSGGGGGLSDAVCVNETHVYNLPANLPLEIAALVEPLSVAWHAIEAAPELSEHNEGKVLIMGGGPIGLAMILCLHAKGVQEIIVSEVATQRQQFARDFGATRVVNPLEEDIQKVVLELSNGKGADVVFDCAGVPASINGALQAVKVRGTVVNVAIWEKEIPFNPNVLTFKESKLRSVLGYQRKDYEAVIANLASGAIKPDCMITGKIKLENLIEDGFTQLIKNKNDHVKVLVDINAK